MNCTARVVSTAVLACLLFTVVRAVGAPQPAVGVKKPTTWLNCTFGPLPDQDVARLHLMIIGQRVQRAVLEPFGLAGTDGSGLKFADGRLTGTLLVGHDQLRMNRSLVPRKSTRLPLQLNLRLERDKVTGVVAGSWKKPDAGDEPIAVRAKVTGVVRGEARLREEFGLDEDAAWPSWLGPNQDFSAGQGSRPLVDDLADARLVWISQWIGPTESGSQRYGACVGCPPAAGGASPLVWKGKVYQFRRA